MSVDRIEQELWALLREHIDDAEADGRAALRDAAILVDDLVANHAGSSDFPMLSRHVAAQVAAIGARQFLKQNERARQAARDTVLALIRGMAMFAGA